MYLTTRHLLLREFLEEDWEAIYAYQSDPLYSRYNATSEQSEEQIQKFVGQFVANQREQPRTKYQLAVVLKAELRVIGNCGVRVNDIALKEGNIGFELDSKCWGHGYATEAAREMVRVGFDEMGLHRIWSWCVADNVGSARVLEKIGMREEGYLKEKDYFRDKWWDHKLFAILDHEWAAQRAAAG